MKVGTDGVLLGAWADIRPGDRVWDAGAGSGLISLMAAQRGASEVKAFEIDRRACEDARANASRTEWAGIIDVTEGDFVKTSAATPGEPNVIISNPPFFTEQLHSPERSRAQARHADSLPVAAIMRTAAQRLAPGGRLALIAPAARLDDLEFEARLARLTLARLTRVITTSGREPKRILAEWCVTGQSAPAFSTMLTIRDRDGRLTDEYLKLTSGFYL